MKKQIEHDIEQSDLNFGNIVNDVRTLIGGGDVIKISDPAFAALMRRVGVSCLQYLKGQLRGIACRIQVVPFEKKFFESFSIRLSRNTGVPTEFDRRLKAIQTQAICPTMTVQAYISAEGILRGAAAVNTKALIDHVINGQAERDYKTVPGSDGHLFYSVGWYRLQARGVDVQIIDNEHTDQYKSDALKTQQAEVEYINALKAAAREIRK